MQQILLEENGIEEEDGQEGEEETIKITEAKAPPIFISEGENINL